MHRTSAAAAAIAAVVAGSLILHGCQDATEPTNPAAAANKSPRTATVRGAGTGSGQVVSDPTGITCSISSGGTGTSDCTEVYPWKTVVTLRATPVPGHSFTGWSGACTGTGTCQLNMTQDRTVTATFSNTVASPPEATRGKWGPLFSTGGIVALHASLVPKGGGTAVLVWGHAGVQYISTDPASYNPASPTLSFSAQDNGVETFCAGHTFLPDGSLLVAGGHDEALGDGSGIANANRLANGLWQTPAPSAMSFARWYPTLTTLVNGDVVSYAGTDKNKVRVGIPEVWSWSTKSWRQLTGANQTFEYYPRSFLAPDGRVFYAGEDNPSRWLDPDGSGAWSATTVSRRVAGRNYGTAVMYAPGKVIYIGGGDPPTATTEVIDLNVSSPAWSAASSMAFPRRQLNATILADGRVLVTGGTMGAGFTNLSGGVRDAEVWDPPPPTGSGTGWKTWEREDIVRVYHGTALLLPDGRVFSAGSGDGSGLPNQTQGQIFTPPNLFNADGSLAARPAISGVSDTSLAYNNQSFTITTPDAAAIAKVHLVRFSSVTHAFNMSQTLYPVAFTKGTGSLSAVGPANGGQAPPGPYMLFLVNSAGVPSVAKLVTVGP